MSVIFDLGYEITQQLYDQLGDGFVFFASIVTSC
jgi:hypothetical protein